MMTSFRLLAPLAVAAATALAAPAWAAGDAGALPAFADPFNDSGLPHSCQSVEPRERLKVGLELECEGDGPPEAPAPPKVGEPLRDAEIPELYRRVLTLPGAKLHADAGGAPLGAQLPTFTIFHVYDERLVGDETWIEVGKNAFGAKDGWLKMTEAENWRSMLVMQFAPKGERGRVLLFKRETDLKDFVTDPHVIAEARALFEEYAAGDYDDDYLVAIEPELAVAEGSSYLMPILDHVSVASMTGERFLLLQVAGLNADKKAPVQQDAKVQMEDRGLARRERALRKAKVALTFVIDTTRSMQPFISETHKLVAGVEQDLLKADALSLLSIGLVGFRDNILPDRRIGYVSKVFQPLGPNSNPSQTVRQFGAMRAADVPTKGFSEDVYAGLHTAVNRMNWDGYAAKVLVLVTDAAPRSGADPLAQLRNYGALNLIEDARRRGIGVLVAHLRTPAGLRSGNFAVAQQEYRKLQAAGDPSSQKYFAIEATDATVYAEQMQGLRAALVKVIRDWARSRAQMPAATVAQAAAPSAPPPKATLASALRNELFRGQMEYLGQGRGQNAPRFYRAWAADRDLTTLRAKALEVKVFLTRNQLDALARGLETILEAYSLQASSGADFFEALQSISAQTSTTGGRAPEVEKAGDVLPKFIAALPYRSKVLKITPEDWRDLGAGGQRELKNELEAKLRIFRDLGADKSAWTDLGAGDAGLEVHPVDLDLLP